MTEEDELLILWYDIQAKYIEIYISVFGLTHTGYVLE